LIELDDWRTAVAQLPPAAAAALDRFGPQIAARLLQSPAEPYLPLVDTMAQVRDHAGG
jgi:hypothetical protein